MDYSKLKNKVKSLNEVLNNTKEYRKEWDNGLRDKIINTLEEINKEGNVNAEIDIYDQLYGLEAVSFTLGKEESGIYEVVNDEVKQPLLRMNGLLMFQQMFNGKISIWVNYPYINGVGEPKPPRMLEIVRPHELKEVNILRYVEMLIDDVREWEDYDDDEPASHHNIGFTHKAASIKR